MKIAKIFQKHEARHFSCIGLKNTNIAQISSVKKENGTTLEKLEKEPKTTRKRNGFML